MRFYWISSIYFNEFIHSSSDSGNLDRKVLFFFEPTSGHFQILSRLTVMVGFNIYSQNHKKFRDANPLLWNCIQTTKRQSCTIQHQKNFSHFSFILKVEGKELGFIYVELISFCHWFYDCYARCIECLRDTRNVSCDKPYGFQPLS